MVIQKKKNVNHLEKKIIIPKDAQCFLVFELRLILYFTFVVHSGRDEFRIFFMLGGHQPQFPNPFWLNLPSQLVISYHWLAFLNQVRKKSPNFTVNHCWIHNRPYLENYQKLKKNHELKNLFQNIAHLLGTIIYFFSQMVKKNYFWTNISQKLKIA